MTADLPGETTGDGPRTKPAGAAMAWADIAPRSFVDGSWQRWWPVAAAIGVVLLGIGLAVWRRPYGLTMLCSGTFGLVAIACLLFIMARSVKTITADAAGLHARHAFGAVTHLPWGQITSFYGGGRYGAPLTVISPDARLGLSRRLTDWPELYALVRRARPELWATLDPARLKSSFSALLALVIFLQLPNAVSMATGTRPIFGTAYSVLIGVWLVWFLFFEQRSIDLSAAGLRVKFPLHSRFVSRSDITGFTFVDRPFWRRGVKLVKRDGKQFNLGIMACGEAYMLEVLNAWHDGRLMTPASARR